MGNLLVIIKENAISSPILKEHWKTIEKPLKKMLNN